MIVKNADDKSAAIAALESLHGRTGGKQQKLVEDELRMLRAGIKGEQESSYHIDFDLRGSEITAVIHDLRLDLGGRVAQIDHLVIHRTHKFYVLETKSFAHGLKITDEGEFLRWNDWKKTYEGTPSPIEQNRRHAEVLRYVLEKLGYPNPEIESFILISPTARIDRSKLHPCPEVVKSDQFITALKKRYEASMSTIGGFFGGAAKALFGDSAEAIAQQLVRLHEPIAIDYEAKFGVSTKSVHSTLLPAAPVAIPPEQAACSIPVGPWGNRTDIPSCKSCGGKVLAIEYGKYGYYLKCKACDANTALKIGCGIDGHKERIRKDKMMFYRECEQCGSSRVFHVNEP